MAFEAEEISRLYDFENGTPSNANEVDAELNQLLLQVNNLVSDIQVQLASIVNGDSGLDNIGGTAISGLTGTTGQALLESLKDYADALAISGIADGSLEAIKAVDEFYFGGQNYGTTTNVGNVYSLSTARSLTSVPEGYPFRFKCNADSDGATSLTIDTASAGNIVKANGSAVTNLKEDGIYTVVKSGSAFMLQGEGASGDALASNLLLGKTATTDVGEITGTMPNREGDTIPVSIDGGSTVLFATPLDGYYDGVDDRIGIIDFDFLHSNILEGINLFDIDGSAIERETATGSATTTTLTVSGLSFQPTTIVVTWPNVFNYRTVYTNQVAINMNNYYYQDNGGSGATSSAWTINADGFSIQPVSGSQSYTWVAYK